MSSISIENVILDGKNKFHIYAPYQDNINLFIPRIMASELLYPCPNYYESKAIKFPSGMENPNA